MVHCRAHGRSLDPDTRAPQGVTQPDQRPSELWYRQLFENLCEDVTVYRVARDGQGQVTDWLMVEANAIGRRSFPGGYEAAIGRPITEVFGTLAMRRDIDRSAAILAGEVIVEDVYFAPANAHYRTTLFALDQDTIIEASLDITDRVRAQEALVHSLAENDRVVTELREALARVQTFAGLLPICMYCKKIRKDDGYWDRIEKYITEHSAAQFSHGLCPDCFAEHVEPRLNEPRFGEHG
jgi:hypothetical protein